MFQTPCPYFYMFTVRLDSTEKHYLTTVLFFFFFFFNKKCVSVKPIYFQWILYTVYEIYKRLFFITIFIINKSYSTIYYSIFSTKFLIFNQIYYCIFNNKFLIFNKINYIQIKHNILICGVNLTKPSLHIIFVKTTIGSFRIQVSKCFGHRAHIFICLYKRVPIHFYLILCIIYEIYKLLFFFITIFIKNKLYI